MTTINVLYRYRNHADVVLLETYRVIKRTPKGFWIQEHPFGKKRFVLDYGVKRFAYSDKNLAKSSFLARKDRELVILDARIQNVERSIVNMRADKIGYGFSRHRELPDFVV